MSRQRDERDLARIVQALQEQPYTEPGPSRLELERRRLLTRLAQLETRTKRASSPNGLRLWPVFAGLAAAACAAIVWLVKPGEPEREADVVRLTGTWKLVPSDSISQGARIVVPQSSNAALVLPDGTRLWFAADTELQVADELGDTVRLRRGQLLAKVEPRTSPRSFRVVTQQATVIVHGTLFTVIAKDDSSLVRLHEGKIELAVDDRRIDVQPGHEVLVFSSSETELGSFGTAEKLADLSLAGEDLKSLGAMENVLSIFGSPTASDDNDARNRTEPLALAPFLGAADRIMDSPEEAPRGRAAEVPKEDGDVVARASDQPQPTEHSTAPGQGYDGEDRGANRSMAMRLRELYRDKQFEKLLELSGTASTDNPDVHYYRGRALESLERYEEAAKDYGAISQLEPARSAEASYLAARALYMAQSFDAAYELSAKASASQGPVAEAARYLGIQCLIRAGRYSAAAEASRVYLDGYPTGPHLEEATYLLAVALTLGGDKESGRAAFRTYLSAFPNGRYVERATAALSQSNE